MRTVFIDNLQHGQAVSEIWAVRRCDSRTGKNGKPFLWFEFGDRTGTIAGRHWNPTHDECRQAGEIEFCRVFGTVDTPWGLHLSRFPQFVDCPDDLSPFLQLSPIPFDDLTRRFDALMMQVREPQLAALLQRYFAPNSLVRARFFLAPAAVRYHHAFQHGLLQHTIEVAEMALVMHDTGSGADCCEPFQRDLLLTGALLHDIGKVREISGDACGYRFSTVGQLMGYTTLGMMSVYATIGKSIPSPLRELLTSMIASHHGSYEYGAASLPLTREALILHQADHLTTQLYYADEARKAARKAGGGDDFADAPLLPGKRVFVGDYGFAQPVGALETSDTFSGEKTWRVVCPWRDNDKDFLSATGNNFALVRLPLLARVAAGPGIYAEADLNGHYPVRAWAKDVSETSHYLLSVSGDSMTGAGICDNDLLVVQPTRQAEHGDIVVATLPDGAVTVKRFEAGVGAHSPLLHADSVETPYPSPFVPAGTAFRLEGVARGVLKPA